MALLRADGTIASVWTFRPEMVETEVVSAVDDAVKLLRAYDSRECVFEKVQYIGGNGPPCPACKRRGGGDGGRGAFTFGGINGLLRGSLLALGVRPRYVMPMMWQAEMECLSGGSKNVTKLRAAQLFPSERVNHGSADALLIAEFGRRRLMREAEQARAAENRHR